MYVISEYCVFGSHNYEVFNKGAKSRFQGKYRNLVTNKQAVLDT